MIVNDILNNEDKNKVYQSYRINKWLESKIDTLLQEIYHLDHTLLPVTIEQITKLDLEELHQNILKSKSQFHKLHRESNI